MGFVVAAAVLLAGARFGWLPHYRPVLHGREKYGIDVSNHQGHIDWNRVAHDGISFAYIKATEGGDFIDHDFAANWASSAGTGIERGAYHFFTLCTPGVAQAQNFLHTVPPDPNALAPAVDLELAGNCHSRPNREAVVAQLNDFLATVEEATHKPTVLYVGDDFERRYRVNEALARPSWKAHFVLQPGGHWTIWQVDSSAHVDGISGGVDLDVLR
ncbi:MAG TPA: GH25 family lysozyme [Acidimicrobiales bacterium]|nr:GH25 family lysozyme [Acidimicrobiales bacterium]